MTETAVAAPVETRDTKLEIIMGREALDKLADATVLVLGCGGVGSNCCEALARGGIGHFVILDKDTLRPAISTVRPSRFTAPSASVKLMSWRP